MVYMLWRSRGGALSHRSRRIAMPLHVDEYVCAFACVRACLRDAIHGLDDELGTVRCSLAAAATEANSLHHVELFTGKRISLVYFTNDRYAEASADDQARRDYEAAPRYVLRPLCVGAV